jgi:hypothetical protein
MAKCKFFVSAIQVYRAMCKEMGVTGFNELLSYFEIRQQKMSFETLREIVKDRKHFLLDSGAYSSMTMNKPIKVEEFIAWHKDLAQAVPEIEFKAGLDDIMNPENSIKNQIATDEAGLDLFPTYHRKDPISVLRWIQERKYKMMGFGGLAGGGLTEEDAITDWIEDAFDEVCIDGKPTINVHLFGVSNIRIISQFPAFSNDSASIIFTAYTGNTWIPFLDPYTHKPDWSRPMVRISISIENPNRGTDGQHYMTLREGQKRLIAEYMASEGFDVNDIINTYQSRGAWTTKMMVLQTDNYPDNVVFKRRPKEFNLFE